MAKLMTPPISPSIKLSLAPTMKPRTAITMAVVFTHWGLLNLISVSIVLFLVGVLFSLTHTDRKKFPREESYLGETRDGFS